MGEVEFLVSFISKLPSPKEPSHLQAAATHSKLANTSLVINQKGSLQSEQRSQALT